MMALKGYSDRYLELFLAEVLNRMGTTTVNLLLSGLPRSSGKTSTIVELARKLSYPLPKRVLVVTKFHHQAVELEERFRAAHPDYGNAPTFLSIDAEFDPYHQYDWVLLDEFSKFKKGVWPRGTQGTIGLSS